MSRAPRGRSLVALALVATLALGGCLTLSPSVTADVGNSTVFENVSTGDSWASGDISATVSLTPNATTTGGVGKLNVIAPDGTTFSTTTLDTGQTSATVLVPTGANATLVAVNPVNGTAIESRSVTTTGNTLF